MSATSAIETLLTVIKMVKETLNSRRNESIDALGAVRKAFNYTYDYLKNNRGEYESNMELANLWNDASVKVMRVDYDLGDLLATKSRFWTHPELYIDLNREDEVLTLEQITDEMERMKKRIK